MSEEEIQRRLPVWIALAALFLDTETQDWEYRWIAEVCRGSGYGWDEVRGMLLEEVAPVFAANLTLTAGEWGCWRDSFVEEVMRKQVAHPSRLRWPYGKRMVRHLEAEWRKVLAVE